MASALTVLLLLLAPTRSWAQDGDPQETEADAGPSAADLAEAQRLFMSGTEHFSASRGAAAVDSFRQSLALAPRASTAYNLAQALQHIGQPTASLDVLRAIEAGEYGPADDLNLSEATETAELALGTIRVSVTHDGERPVDGIEVLVDGDRCAQLTHSGATSCRVDPGTHTVRATALDHADGREVVAVTPGGVAVAGFHLRVLSDSRPGVLTVESLPDAEIQIEGYGTGTGSLRLELAPQQYQVRVSGGGNSQTSSVDVPPGRSVRLYLEPRVTPIYESPWLWVTVAAVLAGAGVALGWALTNIEGPTTPGSVEILREAFP